MVAGRYVGMDLFLPNAVVVHSDRQVDGGLVPRTGQAIQRLL